MKKWKRSVALLVAGLPVGLLLGLGSCAARVPVTVSADSPPNEHTEAEAASAEDLEYGGSGLGASGGANGLDGGAPNGEGYPYSFSDSEAHPNAGPRPKPPHTVR